MFNIDKYNQQIIIIIPNVFIIVLTWIILSTTNPYDSRTRHSWFSKLKRRTTEENSRLGNRKNYRTIMRATCGGGGVERARANNRLDNVTGGGQLLTAWVPRTRVLNSAPLLRSVRPRWYLVTALWRGVTGSADAHALWRVRSSRPTAVFSCGSLPPQIIVLDINKTTHKPCRIHNIIIKLP